MNCLHCIYYVRTADQPSGACHGKPPVVMLLPVAPAPRSQIETGGRAQGFALQTVRPMVQAVDVACSLVKTASS